MAPRHAEWEDDPIGDTDSGVRRRWRRAWNHYLAVMVGLVGVIMAIGTVTVGGRPLVGAVLVLLGAAAIVRADGPRATNKRPYVPPPTRRHELVWSGAAAVLVVLGVILFAA